jgi:hypothetical protein
MIGANVSQNAPSLNHSGFSLILYKYILFSNTSSMKSKQSACMLAVTLAAFSCMAVSCAGGGRARQSGPFFTVTFGETVPAFSDSSSDAELDVSLTLLDSAEPALKRLVREALYGGLSPEDYARAILDDWKTPYPLPLEENSDWGADQSWSYEESAAAEITGPYAVISRSLYQYHGGAHGFSYTSYLTLDMRTALPLGLRDIIPEENASRLAVLIDRELRAFSEHERDIPIPPGSPLSSGFYFEDTVEPSDFYPARNGILFHWNIYEIAPYAAGAVDIMLGWKDLAGILSPAGADMAAAYGR